jgi:hypothetical protein
LTEPSFGGAGFAQRVDNPAVNKGDRKRSTAMAERTRSRKDLEIRQAMVANKVVSTFRDCI